MGEGLRLMTRYARQMQLPEIGTEGQDRLRAAHVLVVGAGGLGCPVLQYLGGAGVGQLTVVDPDRVEESNLHRQTLYRMTDIGDAKAEAACRHIRAANPGLNARAAIASLTPTNAAELVARADIVIDAADSFAVTYILSDTCNDLERPLVTASALGQSGYAGVFCGAAPSVRSVFPDIPKSNATCATSGVMGSLVGVLGSLQAHMALQLLIDHDPSPLGHVVTVDLQTMGFGGFSFLGASEPTTYAPFLCASQIVDTDRVFELRDEKEAPRAAVQHAERLAARDVDGVDFVPSQRIVLCCATGARAWTAANTLRSRGAQNLALVAAMADP